MKPEQRLNEYEKEMLHLEISEKNELHEQLKSTRTRQEQERVSRIVEKDFHKQRLMIFSKVEGYKQAVKDLQENKKMKIELTKKEIETLDLALDHLIDEQQDSIDHTKLTLKLREGLKK